MPDSPQTPAGTNASPKPTTTSSARKSDSSSKSSGSKPTAKKPSSKPAAAKKTASGKPAAKKKTASRKPAAQKTSARKPAAARKSTSSKTTARKPATKKSTSAKSTKRPTTRSRTTSARSNGTAGRVREAAGRMGAGPRRVGELVFERVNELVEAGSTAKDAFPVVARELRMTTANVQQHYYRFQRRVRNQAQHTADRAGAGVNQAFRRLGSLAMSGGELTAQLSRRAADSLADVVPDALPRDIAGGIRRAGDVGENVARTVGYAAGTALRNLPEPSEAGKALRGSAQAAGSVATGVGRAVRRKVGV